MEAGFGSEAFRRCSMSIALWCGDDLRSISIDQAAATLDTKVVSNETMVVPRKLSPCESCIFMDAVLHEIGLS